MNPVLFGHAGDERIVAAHQSGDGAIRVYTRAGAGLSSEDRPFYPFFHLAEPRLIEGFSRKHWVRRLEGPGAFNHLCVFEEWPAMWDAVRYILDAHNRRAVEKVETYQALDAIHLLADPVTQYLMQSGRTLFKGLSFAGLRRMQIDIETYTGSGHRFSNASRASDRIILVALADSTGWELLLDGRRHDEREMLQELIRCVRERDPDVIEGHNFFNFDLPYILTRCSLHGITPALGRDGGIPRSFESRTAFAEHPFDYTAAEIPGRHIIDTLLLVQSFDAVKRNMDSYGLKYAAQYFGLAAPERTYVPGEKISWYWDNEPATLAAYAMDDVRETAALSAHLSGSAFYLTSMLPYSYGTVARMGAAAKIESLLVREYLRQKHALPRAGEGTQTTGGYTDIFLTGVLGPVVHADVESLYPSIMIAHGIAPASDDLGVFTGLLRELTTLRLGAKRAMQRMEDPVERSRMDAMQGSYKILINSFYGYLGYTKGMFNDFARADEVTKTGQKILRTMIAEIRREGGKVVEVDTDGIYFVPPAGAGTAEEESAFVAALSAKLPEGITVAMSGRYRKIMSYKKKNYALLGHDGRIRIKGSSLISRSMEQFGRTFVRNAIDFIMQGDFEGLHRLYVQYHGAILAHGLDVRDFARVEALKDTLSAYEEEVNAGRRNRSAAYTVAMASGRPVRPGDKIAYYITGSDPNPRGTDNCKAAEEWDPNFPDENSAYYVRRLNEFSDKFRPFFQPQDFRAIFSADDLFPFNAAGVALIISDVPGDSSPEEEEPKPGGFGIWLEEEQ